MQSGRHYLFQFCLGSSYALFKLIMSPGQNSDVFVSYASADAARVRQILEPLKSSGVLFWRDQERLRGGNSYGGPIVQAIEQAKVVLLFCSRSSLSSDNVRNEIITAWDRGSRKYLPVWIDRPTQISSEIAYWLAGCQWIDASRSRDETWLPKILSALDGLGICRESDVSDDSGNEVQDRPKAVGAKTARAKPLPSILSVNVAKFEQTVAAEMLGCESPSLMFAGLDFRVVPAGRFVLGADPADAQAQADETPPVRQEIARSLLVTSTPINCGMLRRRIVDFTAGRAWQSWLRSVQKLPDNCPAVDVTLEQIDEFCDLNQRETGLRLRLPTEAEWEYFARAGAQSAYWWGKEFRSELVIHGAREPQQLSHQRANNWGLIDVLGNVAEWTGSAYGVLASPEPVRMAESNSTEGRFRVVRGGSFRERRPDELRLSRRQRVAADSASRYIGFRLVADAHETIALIQAR